MSVIEEEEEDHERVEEEVENEEIQEEYQMGDIYVPNMHLLNFEPFAFSNRFFNGQV